MTSGGAVQKFIRLSIQWTQAASVVHTSPSKVKYHPIAVSQRAFWIPFLTIFLRRLKTAHSQQAECGDGTFSGGRFFVIAPISPEAFPW
jgi:hypothetical protein